MDQLPLPKRLEREDKTVAVMIDMYCRRHHGRLVQRQPGLCHDCAALLAYARRRLEVCRFGSAKPTCLNCPTHCYRPEMRERVREVMRDSGPRMLMRHPVLALRHLIDGRRQAPPG